MRATRLPPMSGAGARRPCRRGMTLVELALALTLLAVTMTCLIQLLVMTSVQGEALRSRQEADAALHSLAEEILAWDGTSAELHAQYHNPPSVVVQDGDGDAVFDAGWAKVILRTEVPSTTGSAPRELKLVFGKVSQ